MRNTYTLLDYGNFVDQSNIDQGDPYVQLLPLTNPVTAHADFVKARCNGVDNTGSPSKALLPASQGQHSPESEAEKKEHYEERVISHWPEILAGCLIFITLCVGLIIWRCCCRRDKRCCCRRGKGSSGKGAMGKIKGLEAESGFPAQGSSYAQLQDPASMVNLQEMRGSTYSGSTYGGNYGTNPFAESSQHSINHDHGYGHEPPPPRYEGY